jgi:hypothetical protein
VYQILRCALRNIYFVLRNLWDEHDLAEQFIGFLEQFLEVFPEMKGKKTYLTGESVSSTNLASSTTADYDEISTPEPMSHVRTSASFTPAQFDRRADIADYIYSRLRAVDLNLQGKWIADHMCSRVCK